MEVNDIKEAPYNPRSIKKKALQGLKESISEFGDLSGITVNVTTGRLICGHQRMKILREQYGDKLKWSKEEIQNRYTGDKIKFLLAGADRFPVRLVEWDEAKEKSANIMANNPEIQGTFSEALQPLLAELKVSLKERFEKMNLDRLEKRRQAQIIPNTEFQTVIGESNNYIVLVFKNDVDWLSAQSHFELSPYQTTNSRGRPWAKGMGRVIDGAKYLSRITRR